MNMNETSVFDDENFEDYSSYWGAVFRFARRIFKRAENKDELKELWRDNYHYYIMSKAWRTKSDAAKRRAGFRCQLCNSPENLRTHHRTYERVGEELDDDLIVLCNDCHTSYHARKNNNG